MDCHFRDLPDFQSSEARLMAKPENDSPQEITHKIKSSQPNLMILVLLEWGKNALSSKVKKDNCWSE